MCTLHSKQFNNIEYCIWFLFSYTYLNKKITLYCFQFQQAWRQLFKYQHRDPSKENKSSKSTNLMEIPTRNVCQHETELSVCVDKQAKSSEEQIYAKQECKKQMPEMRWTSHRSVYSISISNVNDDLKYFHLCTAIYYFSLNVMYKLKIKKIVLRNQNYFYFLSFYGLLLKAIVILFLGSREDKTVIFQNFYLKSNILKTHMFAY